MIATQYSTTLADGRELIYYDEAPRQRTEADPRRLRARGGADNDGVVNDADGGVPVGGQVRYDALTGDWVCVAAHRNTRTYLPPTTQCPLCPGSPGQDSEIPGGAYDVAVFENRFPAFGPAAGHLSGERRWGAASPAFGRCEVVAFSSDHHGSFGTLSPERAGTVLQVLGQRTAALNRLPGVAQVFPFENRGADIGVTLTHPHGQIYAYPFLPPRAAVMAEQAQAFHERTGKILLTDIVERERDDGARMILEREHCSAFVPFAAHWPLEVHIVPHRQLADLAEASPAELSELALTYLDVLRRFEALYPSPTPYIAAWHQAPLDPRLRAVTGLHLQITSPRRAVDKLKFPAGSETGMGAFINDTVAERVAASLRDASHAGPASREGR